ncbi:MAG: hypothetical protein ACO3GO_07230 [Terrimicrobiaceae bacterium]
MNPRTARNLLAIYIEDPNETAPPAVQKALKAIGRSPELQAEIDRQTVLDARARRIIGGVEIPFEAEETLSAKVAALPAGRFNPRDPAIFAAAVGFFLLVLVLAWNFLGRPAAFPPDAAEIAERLLEIDDEPLDPVGEPAGEVEDWFLMKGFDGFKVPEHLASHLAESGGILKIGNQPVAVVTIPQRNARFIVFPADPFGIDIPEGEWRTASIDDQYAAAIREEGGMCFMILRRGSLASVRDLLGTSVR